MRDNLKNLLAAIGWLWFLAWVCIAAVGMVAGAHLAAACFLVCGAAAWPPLWSELAKRGATLTAGNRAGIGILAFILAIVAAGRSNDATTDARPVARAAPVAAISTVNNLANEPVIEASKADEVERGRTAARNQAKIASLLAVMKTLGDRDYEARLSFWNDIVALAPANAEYARRQQEMADEVARLGYLRENPELGAVVERIRPRKEGFGNVLVIDITLRNDALSHLKDFQISCTTRARSGTIVSNNTRTLYEVVDARSTRTFRKLNMGFINSQSSKTNCVVDGASIA
jgi:hypothetical protein